MNCPEYSVHNAYIADGFADDCEELIHRCSRVDILSYQTFCIYYKDMNFASIFQGRISNSEIAELSEELLQVAKNYMVQDTSNFEESVAGLFLVYALMNLQPYPRFAHLRITPEDLPALGRIEQVARRERRYDVLYVLGSVLVKGPVQYHAAARERGLESTLRKYLEGPCSAEGGARPRGVYYRQNEELDIIREMAAVFKKYSKAKEQIPGLKTRSLKYSNDNLAEDLGTSLRRLINGITKDEATEPADHYNAVQEIKARAMRGAVGVMKHLAPVALRSPEKTPQRNNETSPKTPSPKPVTPKRAKSKTQAKKPKLTKIENSSSSSEEEVEEEFCRKRGRSSASITFDKTDEEESTHEIPTGSESLPPIPTVESDSKPIEIEIIDRTKSKKKGTKKSDDAIFKKPLRVSPRCKASRRDMKKPILKSKFKKMGMLPVANFEDK